MNFCPSLILTAAFILTGAYAAPALSCCQDGSCCCTKSKEASQASEAVSAPTCRAAFLTSNPALEKEWGAEKDQLNFKNNFAENLKKYWTPNSKCLFITASPLDHKSNDKMSKLYGKVLNEAGLSISKFDVLDSRTADKFNKNKIQSYDMIFLGGGHVPTQRKWFKDISLKDNLKGFRGLLISLSAGSMNSAQTVYAWPEEKGESIDPDYELFFEGLGYTKAMMLPHYYAYKDRLLDGKRVLEDIAFVHSREHGRTFLVLPDGSYILSKDGTETVYGEAFLIKDGKLVPYCLDGESRIYKED